MKKGIYVIGLVFVGIGGCLLFSFISQNEKNNLSPVERYQENIEDINNESSDQDTTPEAETAKQPAIVHESLKYEILSYEIIDDSEIASQTKYAAEHFCNGELPDPDMMEEYQDTEAIMEQCPELKDLWENSESYSVEETKEIYNSHLDVIEANTSMVHSDRHYVFVKVRVTNPWNRSVSQYLSELECVISSKDKEQYGTRTDTMCYFDQSRHTEGEDRIHSFFLYEFEPNETIECTLGFAVRDEVENPDYYIGFVDTELQNEGMNPTLGKYMVNLGNIEGSVE